jgi:hypothetical protein
MTFVGSTFHSIGTLFLRSLDVPGTASREAWSCELIFLFLNLIVILFRKRMHRMHVEKQVLQRAPHAESW